MRTVFDWQAFGGCIGGLIVLALGGDRLASACKHTF